MEELNKEVNELEDNVSIETNVNESTNVEESTNGEESTFEEALPEVKKEKLKIDGMLVLKSVAVIVLVVILLFGACYFIVNGIKYNKAMDDFNSGEFSDAKYEFQELGNYRDSKELSEKAELFYLTDPFPYYALDNDFIVNGGSIVLNLYSNNNGVIEYIESKTLSNATKDTFTTGKLYGDYEVYSIFPECKVDGYYYSLGGNGIVVKRVDIDNMTVEYDVTFDLNKNEESK